MCSESPRRSPMLARGSISHFLLALVALATTPLLRAGEGETPSRPQVVPEGSTGSGGAKLEIEPTDIRDQCDSPILRGNGNFKGTAFIAPLAFPVVDDESSQLFSIIQRADGKFLLRMALYFPRDTDVVKLKKDRSAAAAEGLVGCDVATILKHLNQGRAPKDQLIRLTSLPVSRIKVDIPGGIKPFTIGTPTTNILNYQGRKMPVEFVVNTQSELDDLYARIADQNIGLPVYVSAIFTAHEVKGSVNAQIDRNEVAVALDMGLAAERPPVAAVKVQAALRNVMKKITASMEVMGDNTQAAEEMAMNIFKDVIGEKPTLLKDATPEPGATGNGKVVDVAAFVQAIRDSSKLEFHYSSLGGSKNFEYMIPITLKGKVMNPFHRELLSGTGSAPRTYFEDIREGQQMKIYPLRKTEQRMEYVMREAEYFNKQEIAEYHMEDYFPQLLKNNNIPLVDGGRSWNGKPIATLAHQKLTITDWRRLFDYKYYVFGRYELVSKTVDQAKVEDVAANSLEDLKQIPIQVNFSERGARWYGFWELATDQRDVTDPNDPAQQNDPSRLVWKASYDPNAQVIHFKANKKLGAATLRNIGKGGAERIVSALFYESWNWNPNTLRFRSPPERAVQKRARVADVTSTYSLKVIVNPMKDQLQKLGAKIENSAPTGTATTSGGSPVIVANPQPN